MSERRILVLNAIVSGINALTFGFMAIGGSDRPVLSGMVAVLALGVAVLAGVRYARLRRGDRDE